MNIKISSTMRMIPAPNSFSIGQVRLSSRPEYTEKGFINHFSGDKYRGITVTVGEINKSFFQLTIISRGGEQPLGEAGMAALYRVIRKATERQLFLFKGSLAGIEVQNAGNQTITLTIPNNERKLAGYQSYLSKLLSAYLK